MNNFTGIGRITKDLELKTYNEKSCLRFALAIQDKFKKDKAHFINCVAWGKTAEIMAQHLGKGRMIGIEASVNTGSYDKDGTTVYTTDFNINTFTFCDSKKSDGSEMVEAQEEGEDDLPF